MLKKSQVLREGYIRGLKEAQRIIKEKINSHLYSGRHKIPSRRFKGLKDCEIQDIISSNVFDLMDDNDVNDLCKRIQVYDTYEEAQRELNLDDYEDEIDINPNLLELGSTGRFVFFL